MGIRISQDEFNQPQLTYREQFALVAEALGKWPDNDPVKSHTAVIVLLHPPMECWVYFSKSKTNVNCKVKVFKRPK